MKVQLQTNYSNRSFAQKTNKVQACAKPNFMAMIQFCAPKDAGISLFRGVEMLFESYKPIGKVLNGIALDEPRIRCVQADFPEDTYNAVLNSLRAAVTNERDVRITEFN